MAKRRKRRGLSPDDLRTALEQVEDAIILARQLTQLLSREGASIRERGLTALERDGSGRTVRSNLYAAWARWEEALNAGLVASRISGMLRGRDALPMPVGGPGPRARSIPAMVDKLPASATGRLKREMYPSVQRLRAEVERTLDARVRPALAEIVQQGMHTMQAKAHLAEAFRVAGVVPENSYTLENIARTWTAIAYGAGRMDLDFSPAVQEILWGYTYVTVGDDRVRETHAELDGTTLPKEHPFWHEHYPPWSWSCRCSAIARFEPRPLVVPPNFAGPPVGTFPAPAQQWPRAADIAAPRNVSERIRRQRRTG